MPAMPLPSPPHPQPAVAVGMGPHLERIRGLPDVAGPWARRSCGVVGGLVAAPRWLLPPPAHSPATSSATLTFPGAIWGEQGGHWKRQGWKLGADPRTAPGTPNPTAPQNSTAPHTPQPLPPPLGTPHLQDSPSSISPQPWSALGTGNSWMEKGKAAVFPPRGGDEVLAWLSLRVCGSAGPNQPLQAAPTGLGIGRMWLCPRGLQPPALIYTPGRIPALGHSNESPWWDEGSQRHSGMRNRSAGDVSQLWQRSGDARREQRGPWP